MRLAAYANAIVGVCLLVLTGATGLAADDGNIDALIARMDALWAHRDDKGAVADSVSLGTIALSIDPHSYPVHWRIARVYFWAAYTQPSRVAKKALATKAIEWAERARAEQPNGVEGHYFYAIALGEYAGTIGIMQAIVDGVAGKVESAALRAHEIDRDFLNGAPATVLGRYYFLLPWPKQDLNKSRVLLEEVVTRHPRALLAHVYLADTYHELDKDKKAREQLEFVLTNDPEPGTELDRPPAKPLARELMQKWSSD